MILCRKSCELFSDNALRPALPHASSSTSLESAHRPHTCRNSVWLLLKFCLGCASRIGDETRSQAREPLLQCLRINGKRTLCRIASLLPKASDLENLFAYVFNYSLYERNEGVKGLKHFCASYKASFIWTFKILIKEFYRL